jgi:hypothetical protein
MPLDSIKLLPKLIMRLIKSYSLMHLMVIYWIEITIIENPYNQDYLKELILKKVLPMEVYNNRIKFKSHLLWMDKWFN